MLSFVLAFFSGIYSVFFFEMGAAGPQPRAPVVLRSTTCFSSTCGKTVWEIWSAAIQLLFVFFFAVHQCAFWNVNLRFFFVFTSSPVWFLEQPVVFFYGHRCAFVSAHFSREEKAE